MPHERGLRPGRPRPPARRPRGALRPRVSRIVPGRSPSSWAPSPSGYWNTSPSETLTGGSACEAVEPNGPRCVEVCARGEAAVELEDRHPMGECPGRPGTIRIAADRDDHRLGGPGLEALGQALPRQRPAGHQPVQVRMCERPAPIGPTELGERLLPRSPIAQPLDRPMKLGPYLLEGLGHEQRLELLLRLDVFVEGGRSDPHGLGQEPHGEPLWSFAFEDLTMRRLAEAMGIRAPSAFAREPRSTR